MSRCRQHSRARIPRDQIQDEFLFMRYPERRSPTPTPSLTLLTKSLAGNPPRSRLDSAMGSVERGRWGINPKGEKIDFTLVGSGMPVAGQRAERGLTIGTRLGIREWRRGDNFKNKQGHSELKFCLSLVSLLFHYGHFRNWRFSLTRQAMTGHRSPYAVNLVGLIPCALLGRPFALANLCCTPAAAGGLSPRSCG
ncbi:hypothetical protein H4582DRAFT_1393675 [Lactarius indigo]|nr:hypothetical protein H4582DRAFT_1393675 [Lactarius indigo]